MRVLLFGATGMVGQGVLRECLLDPGVTAVQTIGRRPTGVRHAKLREIIHRDLMDYRASEADLTGFDACFFCLGVSSFGMKESEYEPITYGITLAAAETLSRLNPGMTFVYVSGAGTDSTEHGRLMWARVKGRTENALQRLGFRAAYAFRPGFIEPMHGVTSSTRWYRVAYTILRPLVFVLRPLLGSHILTTEQMGRAMLAVVRRGAPVRVLEVKDIRALSPT